MGIAHGGSFLCGGGRHGGHRGGLGAVPWVRARRWTPAESSPRRPRCWSRRRRRHAVAAAVDCRLLHALRGRDQGGARRSGLLGCVGGVVLTRGHGHLGGGRQGGRLVERCHALLQAGQRPGSRGACRGSPAARTGRCGTSVRSTSTSAAVRCQSNIRHGSDGSRPRSCVHAGCSRARAAPALLQADADVVVPLGRGGRATRRGGVRPGGGGRQRSTPAPRRRVRGRRRGQRAGRCPRGPSRCASAAPPARRLRWRARAARTRRGGSERGRGRSPPRAGATSARAPHDSCPSQGRGELGAEGALATIAPARSSSARVATSACWSMSVTRSSTRSCSARIVSCADSSRLGAGGDLLERVGDGRGVVEGEVEPVALLPAGQGRVGVLAAHGRVTEHVGVLGGEALGAADGAGVADLDVLGDVAGGQLDHGAVLGVGDVEGAVVGGSR